MGTRGCKYACLISQSRQTPDYAKAYIVPISLTKHTCNDLRAKGNSWDVGFAANISIAFLVIGVVLKSANTANALVTGSIHGDDGALRVYSDAPKHLMSDTSLFTSWGHIVVNVKFDTFVGTTITSRAVGIVKFKFLFPLQ